MINYPSQATSNRAFIQQAIRELTSHATVQHESVKVVVHSLKNSDLSESEWRRLFDEQGADKALDQEIYSPEMIRLLTLRAIVIPETLPDYLIWLENTDQQDSTYQVSAIFQSQFYNSCKTLGRAIVNIEKNLEQGLQLLIPALLKSQNLSYEALHRFLSLPNGAWGNLRYQLIQDLEKDLNTVNFSCSQARQNIPLKLTNLSWQGIWRELKNYWQPNYKTFREKYMPVAALLEKLGEHKKAAFFYHVAAGKVPERIFNQLDLYSLQTNLYGVWVEREITMPEKFLFVPLKKGADFLIKVINLHVPCYMTVGTLLIGVGTGRIYADARRNEQAQKNNLQTVTQVAAQKHLVAQQKMPIEKKLEAIQDVKVQKTDAAIEQIVQEIQKEQPGINYDKVIGKIQSVLKVSLNYSLAVQQAGPDRNRLIEAIYSYQREKFGEKLALGYMQPNQPTPKLLKNEVKQFLDRK